MSSSNLCHGCFVSLRPLDRTSAWLERPCTMCRLCALWGGSRPVSSSGSPGTGPVHYGACSHSLHFILDWWIFRPLAFLQILPQTHFHIWETAQRQLLYFPVASWKVSGKWAPAMQHQAAQASGHSRAELVCGCCPFSTLAQHGEKHLRVSRSRPLVCHHSSLQ